MSQTHGHLLSEEEEILKKEEQLTGNQEIEMSEEWQNFEARWDPACWKNMAFRERRERGIPLEPCRSIIYIHNGSTCTCSVLCASISPFTTSENTAN